MTTSSSKRGLLTLYFRGMRLISRYIPHFFTAIACHSVIAAVTPYVTLWLFAMVLDRLAAEPATAVWPWIAAAVAAQTLLLLVGGAFRRYSEMLWERLYRQTDRLLSDALLSMDTTASSDPRTAALLLEVKENVHALGAGLVRIPHIYQRLVSGSCGVMAAIGFSWSLFTLPVAQSAGPFTFLDSPLWVPLLAVVWCAVTAGASCMAAKAERLQAAKSADIVALDREYLAYFESVLDAAKAVDMRLWNQAAVVLHHLRAVEETCFSEDGVKRRLGNGRVGLFKALASALTVLWWGIACAFVVLKAFFGAFGIGAAVQYIGALTRLSADAAEVMRGAEQFRANARYLETVFAFLDVPQPMYAGTLTTEKRADNDFEIVFDHVSFRYPDQPTWALCDVSFTLRGRKKLAVVGEDGSGKSTLLELICRLYDPEQGAVYLGGIDIRKYRYAEYIALVAAAFEDTALLDEPLGNVVACDTQFDEARVRACLEASGFSAAVSLDEIYASSATERQQIAVARALYKDSPFLALDETYVRADAVASRGVIYSSRQPTAYCRECDEILVLDRGSIVQRGTHDALMADREGKYYALWQARARLYI